MMNKEKYKEKEKDNDDKMNRVNLKINGRIFPNFVLKNYSKYKLNKDDLSDKCGNKEEGVKKKDKLKLYQEFVGDYLSFKNKTVSSILLYYGTGAGKSATTINLYNILYNSDHNLNVYLLAKSSLRTTWEHQLDKWLSPQDKEHRLKNIKFVNYDNPYLDKDFFEKVKESDASNRNVYIIDEAHLFISYVYGNIKSGKTRALSVYNAIIQDKKENNSRIVAISATPAINEPFELGLLFNLLRPDTFPDNETLFNKYFIDYSLKMPMLSLKMKNLFQRRIIGLVSYYEGASEDMFASKHIEFADVKMSKYQTDKYMYFDKIENEMARKNKYNNYKVPTYRSYTRQAANFVFPDINKVVNAENRPRPSKFKISDRELEVLMKEKDINTEVKNLSTVQQAYFETMDLFRYETEKYFDKIFEENPKGIENDIKNFEKYDHFENYWVEEKQKSKLIIELHKCSCKYINIIFNVYKSKHPVLIYSGFVLLEGITMFKIYLKYFGWHQYNSKDTKDYHSYGEFTGNVTKEERKELVNLETTPENKDGKNIKILFFSSAGAEGISLANITQVHIIEPYWNETRIIQIMGRAIRMCMHTDLPEDERHVDIFRYKAVGDNVLETEVEIDGVISKKIEIIEDENKLKTIDYDVENTSRKKDNEIQSFLDALKEVAVDCTLFKSVNMEKAKYKCFKFNDSSLFDKNIGPAYKENMDEDIKMNNGLNSTGSIVMKVKVIKIRVVAEKDIDHFEKKAFHCWYSPDNGGYIFDYELHYCIGKVKYDNDELVWKLAKDVYVADFINIPVL